jgi:hypothetical protein
MGINHLVSAVSKAPIPIRYGVYQSLHEQLRCSSRRKRPLALSFQNCKRCVLTHITLSVEGAVFEQFTTGRHRRRPAAAAGRHNLHAGRRRHHSRLDLGLGSHRPGRLGDPTDRRSLFSLSAYHDSERCVTPRPPPSRVTVVSRNKS